jgi:hypothetical protein
VRGRTGFLFAFSVVVVLLKIATLPFSPRFNPKKLSDFTFVLESLVVRLFWRTRLVRLKPSPSES